jgi:hypothetical protein
MTEYEKTTDTIARLSVSSEPGHSRIGITRTYIFHLYLHVIL